MADTTKTVKERKTVSERGYVNAESAVVDSIEDASGGTYKLLGDGGTTFTYVHGKNPQMDAKFAIFGFHTKVGNVANTVLNDKDNPGTPADAAATITDWMAALEADGTWTSEREGGVGVRIDKDALAAAYVEYASGLGKTTMNDGRPLDIANVREQLESKPVLIRQMRGVPEVARLYADKVGKPIKSADEIVGLV